MSPLVVVAECDLGPLKTIGLPVEIAVLAEETDTPAVFVDGRSMSLQELSPALLGGIGVSEQGVRALKRLFRQVADVADVPQPWVCDLSAVASEDHAETALRLITETALSEVDRHARRNIDLSRAIASLREEHANTQAAFERLERFVFQNGLHSRTEAYSLLPSRPEESIALAEGVTLQQRLPISSSGLSDVALFPGEVSAPESGELTVVLSTVEDGMTRATWVVDGRVVAAGQVRLSLPVSLGADELTPLLQISWNGAGVARLKTSLRHPDPRFAVQGSQTESGRVLAMRCWNYLPGCEAPLPANAILPGMSGAERARRWILDPDTLSRHINLTPQSEYTRYAPEFDAIVVHVLATGTSAALIPAALAAGTRHVKARIETRSEKAHEIEYALGAAPVPQRPQKPSLGSITEAWKQGIRPFPWRNRNRDTPVSFDEGLATSWVGLRPLEVGELHLPFVGPLAEPHDLYLMTRLAQRPGDPSWGWSSFSKIEVAMEDG